LGVDPAGRSFHFQGDMATSQVRVRFAPSPTGFFHIGSARTALFNWLYARHTGGVFVLRVEDTDRQRNTPEALAALLDGMRWLGLDWDEGPEKGGAYGPYFQSERGGIYREAIQQLRDIGRAYDHEGAVWFKVSGEPQIIHDRIRGDVTRMEEKDFVIVRSDGNPVFHLVNVVDDWKMGITHVIRGEDHLSNTSKHVELFKALGAEVPDFAHIPLILKQDGPGKMSKRDQGALIEEYQGKKYLPSAVRNYLCLLGWNPKDDRELMPIEEIIERFDFPGINRGNARFDEKKMAHFNSVHLRELDLNTFTWLASEQLASTGLIEPGFDEDQLQKVLALLQPKCNSLEELPTRALPFFSDTLEYQEKALQRIGKKGDPRPALMALPDLLGNVPSWEVSQIDAAIHQFMEKEQLKPGQVMPVVRVAVSGSLDGPDLVASLEVLGQGEVIARIRKFLEADLGDWG